MFQCVLRSLQLHSTFRVVELPVNETKLMFTTMNKIQLRFSSLFDVDFFNQRSRQIGYPEMARLSDFVARDHKYMIYVYSRTSGNQMQRPQRLVWKAERTGDEVNGCLSKKEIINLDEPYQSLLLSDTEFLLQLKPGSCLVRVVELQICHLKRCGNDSHSVNSIKQLIFGEWSSKDVSLVFNHWLHKQFVPLSDSDTNCIQRYTSNETTVFFQPSAQLFSDADKYREMFLGGGSSVGFMLRVERVVKYSLPKAGIGSEGLRECFGEILSLKRRLLVNGTKKAFVTMDVGRFESASFKKEKMFGHYSKKDIVKFSGETFLSIYDNKWSQREWEESFVKAAGGITDIAYIAALQRIVASRSECLVLMGGGTYQSLAVTDYFRYHRHEKGSFQPCIHLVCEMTKGNTEVQKIISKYSKKRD